MAYKTIVYFDASCLVAAAGSPTGGASYLLDSFQGRLLRAVTSGPAIHEAERNLVRKFPPLAFERFIRLQQRRLIRYVPVAKYEKSPAWYESINEKDRHIVGAALHARCAYLLTLDKALAREVSSAQIPLIALSPEIFILDVLPTYPGYR